MYVPKHFAVDDRQEVLAFVRSVGFGHLVSRTADRLDATALPFVVDEALTTVRAHVARANAHWRSLDGDPVLLIVPGTDGYVSPSWYPSKADDPRTVPTWNYELVHVHGTAVVHDEPAFCERVVRDLTAIHETRRVDAGNPAPRWEVDDAPADFVARQLRAIVGVSVAVERVEAKRKLSQNRSAGDQGGVRAGLRGTEIGNAMATLDP